MDSSHLYLKSEEVIEGELINPDQDRMQVLVNELNETLHVKSLEADKENQSQSISAQVKTAAKGIFALGALAIVCQLFVPVVFSIILWTLLAVAIGASALVIFLGHKKLQEAVRGRELAEQKAGERFQTLKKAVQGMVAQDVEKPTVSALNDAYAISRALDRYPELQHTSVDAMKDMIGQTLLAGSLLGQMQDYQATRWQTTNTDKKHLMDLQNELKGQMNQDMDTLQDTVAEATLQLSLIRGEILRMETEALLSQNFTQTLTEMLHRVQSVRESLEIVNGSASRTLLAAQSA